MKLTKTGKPSKQGELISLRVASRSHASHSPKLDEEKARQTVATSGRRCLESFRSFPRAGLWARTFADFLVSKGDWYSSRCALTWKISATKSNRLLFQLVPSMPRTDEIASGLLPTATSRDWKGGTKANIAAGNPKRHLDSEIAMLHTPTSTIRGERSEEAMERRRVFRESIGRKTTPPGGLAEQVYLLGKGRSLKDMMLKTPSASEGEGGWKVADKYWEADQPKLKTRDQVGRVTGLKLQPNFVAWMMGYPQKWATLPSPNPDTESNNSKPTETPSSRRSR